MVACTVILVDSDNTQTLNFSVDEVSQAMNSPDPELNSSADSGLNGGFSGEYGDLLYTFSLEWNHEVDWVDLMNLNIDIEFPHAPTGTWGNYEIYHIAEHDELIVRISGVRVGVFLCDSVDLDQIRELILIMVSKRIQKYWG